MVAFIKNIFRAINKVILPRAFLRGYPTRVQQFLWGDVFLLLVDCSNAGLVGLLRLGPIDGSIRPVEL